jgi:CheY-like chemotaxis protein
MRVLHVAHSTMTSSPSQSTRRPNFPLNVLVAESIGTGPPLTASLLEELGHQVRAFASAEQLLACFEADAADLVLLDLTLRQPGAFHAAEAIRKLELIGRRRTVLFALSAEPPAHLGRCLVGGFDAVLALPIDPKNLEESLERLTGPAVCERELLDRLGGRRDLLRQMSGVLGQSMAAWHADLEAAELSGDGDRARKVAHQMNGALGNLAARYATATATIMENLARSGKVASLRPVRSRLWNELERVRYELARMAE